MDTKVSDITIDELKNLISKTVKDTIDEYLEDLKALSSNDYLNSIREARADYKAGDFKDFDEVL